MENRLAWMWPRTLERLCALRLEPEERPDEYRTRHSDGAILESSGLTTAQHHLHLRYTRAQTSAADVATVMIYPTHEPDRYPVFAAEWVVVKGRCHMAVLDVEDAGAGTLSETLAPTFNAIKETHGVQLTPHKSPPQWFADIATEWSIFTATEAEGLPRLEAAFDEYLGTAVDTFYRAEPTAQPHGPEDPRVAAYKAHHCEHSPGRPMLAAKFGAAWTDRFLKDWHFGPVRPAPTGEDEESPLPPPK